jgi:hypothetical protein
VKNDRTMLRSYRKAAHLAALVPGLVGRFVTGDIRLSNFCGSRVANRADNRSPAAATPAALAVMNATKTIPIVHPNAIDPLKTGLIDSIAHPGRNLTGGAQLTAEVSGKRLEILKKVVPGLSRAAVLWDSANPALVFSWNETQGAARVLGVTRDGLTSATTEDSGRNSDAAIRAPPRRLQEPLSLAQDERLVGRRRRLCRNNATRQVRPRARAVIAASPGYRCRRAAPKKAPGRLVADPDRPTPGRFRPAYATHSTFPTIRYSLIGPNNTPLG